MAESAGAGLMQLSGQDLASWKCFSYIYCARGGKSWLCRTHGAHRVEKDTLLEAHRFEGGHHRQHDGKTRTSCRKARQNGENVNPFGAIAPWLATRAGHGPDGSTPHQYR